MQRWVTSLLLASALGCGGSDEPSEMQAADTSGTDLSSWDNVPGSEPWKQPTQASNASAASRPTVDDGSLSVTLESNCAYAYHIQVRDPQDKVVHDLWIDRGHRRPLRLMPGSRFVFCGQHNECPRKSFYTVPAGKPASPLRVLCPCSESVIGI